MLGPFCPCPRFERGYRSSSAGFPVFGAPSVSRLLQMACTDILYSRVTTLLLSVLATLPATPLPFLGGEQARLAALGP